MANVNFQWDVRDGAQDKLAQRIRPGETVSGTVVITPDTSLTCKNLYLRMKWNTEGRGDTDSRTVAESNVFQGELAAGNPVTFPFRFTTPRGPWSYAGHYINIVWCLEADIDLPMAINPKSQKALILLPR